MDQAQRPNVNRLMSFAQSRIADGDRGPILGAESLIALCQWILHLEDMLGRSPRENDEDGTERLCRAVYSRPAQPRDYLGGSQAHMLHDGADLIARLKAMLDRDRTGLAAALDRVRNIIHGWSWIPDGYWGSYSYEEHTEETLRREVGDLIEKATGECTRSLRASGDIADQALRKKDTLFFHKVNDHEKARETAQWLLNPEDCTNPVERDDFHNLAAAYLEFFGLEDQKACKHEWIDARNKFIQSGEYCRKCHAIRDGNRYGQEEGV